MNFIRALWLASIIGLIWQVWICVQHGIVAGNTYSACHDICRDHIRGVAPANVLSPGSLTVDPYDSGLIRLQKNEIRKQVNSLVANQGVIYTTGNHAVILVGQESETSLRVLHRGHVGKIDITDAMSGTFRRDTW